MTAPEANAGRWLATWRPTCRLTGCLLLLIALVPLASAATTFSFGTISPGDKIQSITLNGTISYDAGFQQLTIDTYVTGIHFLNRADITGITANTVTFFSAPTAASLTYNPSGPGPFVFSVNGLFTNGATDFSILDLGGPPVELMSGNYQNGGLGLGLSVNTGIVLGAVTGPVGGPMTGDADFLAAFGSTGALSGTPSLVLAQTSNLCDTVVTCSFFANPTLESFSATAALTLTTDNVIPEPGTGTLLLLGLLGLHAHRGRFRR